MEDLDGQDQKTKISEGTGSVIEDKVSKAPALEPNKPIIKREKTYLYHANKQYTQLKEQADLLIKQAELIQERVNLAEHIYSLELNFKPVLLKEYFLYEKGLSLISPREWNHEHLGDFISTVRQLGDSTWEKT